MQVVRPRDGRRRAGLAAPCIGGVYTLESVYETTQYDVLHDVADVKYERDREPRDVERTCGGRGAALLDVHAEFGVKVGDARQHL